MNSIFYKRFYVIILQEGMMNGYRLNFRLVLLGVTIACLLLGCGKDKEDSKSPRTVNSANQSLSSTDPGYGFTGGNSDWEPVIQQFEGVEMVLVPAGCFMMGDDDLNADEKPVHEVCFDEPYWIDRYELTNAQFASFEGQAGRESDSTGNDVPRDFITWFEAHRFCANRGEGIRLPTEAEWEYAASGPDNWEYPWGNEFVGDNVVWSEGAAPVLDGKDMANVGSKSGDMSWVGAFDMSGNASEWVNSVYMPYPYSSTDGRESNTDPGNLRVVRGGFASVNLPYFLRTAFRSSTDPASFIGQVGFRCARSKAVSPSTPPQSTPIPAGSSDVSWTPVIQEFDGVEMVLVPAGCFMMGSEKGDDDEKPAHQVCFDGPFWIDRYEVTNAQFAAFDGQAALASNWTEDNRPRESITWLEAQYFCISRQPGTRLPTEAEWEYAARGPNSWEFPWGNEFVGSNVVWFETSGERTADVGSKPEGASWVGALDMSGNVYEWVITLYGPYPYDYTDGRESRFYDPDLGANRVFRGGSWGSDDSHNLQAMNRLRMPSNDFQRFNLGFRCARSQ